MVNPVPFNQSNLTKDDPGCTASNPFNDDQLPILECDPANGTKLSDGDLGTKHGIKSFFAFGQDNEDSAALLFTIPVPVSCVVFHFLNFPSESIGLPDFSVITLDNKNPETQTYTFCDNEDLRLSDAAIRNVTLDLPSFTDLLNIDIVFRNDCVSNWFLISEVEFCNG